MHPKESYQLRWRGRQTGPFTLQEIEQKLDDQDIGMHHEIYHDDRWKTLSDFYVEVSRRARAGESDSTFTSSASYSATDAAHASTQNTSSSGAKGSRLTPHGVTKTVLSSGKELILLDNVTFVIEPNEFVALLGPSGSGKSTLMDAINGRRRATSGSVLVNNDDLYAEFEKLRDNIGYVPQKDIVHLSLTVRQELTFAARLRLSPDTPRETIDQIVTDVITRIGLKERQHTRNSALSGGQLKRVSVGVELLANPTLLFLDEATSGLDPGTEARMMTLFGKLANGGKTIICITHALENLGLCDLAVMLARGKLVYYGPPGDLLTYFNVGQLKDIYRVALGENDETDEPAKKELAAKWAERYRNSEYFQRYVAVRLQQKPPPSSNASFLARASKGNGIIGAFRQFLILIQRYATVTLQDRKNIGLLLVQAPVIAALIAITFRKNPLPPQDETMITFFMAVSAIWFGCSNSAREIVKEEAIYLRERAINLNISAYLGAKMGVLSILCLIQCLVLYFLTTTLTAFHPDTPKFLGVLLVTALCAMMLGLLVSAIVNTVDKAMAIVPILLIPQLLFAGAVVKLSGIAENIAYCAIVSYWSFDGLLHSLGKDPLHPLPKYDLPLDFMSLALFLVVFVGASAVALKLKDKHT